MTTWQDIEDHLAKVNTTDFGGYSERDRQSSDRKAREAIRRAVLDLERKADERDTLRAMLLEQGAENARLALELEQAQIKNPPEETDQP